MKIQSHYVVLALLLAVPFLQGHTLGTQGDGCADDVNITAAIFSAIDQELTMEFGQDELTISLNFRDETPVADGVEDNVSGPIVRPQTIYTVKTPPRFGTLKEVPGDSRSPFTIVGKEDVPYRRVQVTYVPKPGFRGIDSFEYRAQGHHTTQDVTAKVTITVVDRQVCEGPIDVAPGIAFDRLRGLVSGDFNLDGRQDLVSLDASAARLHLLRANRKFDSADNTLATGGVILDGLADAVNLQVADMDLDGRPDLVIGRFGSINVQLNKATGFERMAQVGQGLNLNSVSVGDLNGDGRPDLIAATASNLRVFLANASGEFEAEQVLHTGAVRVAQVRDFNADKQADLLFGDATGVKFLQGKTGGGFEPLATVATGNQITKLITGKITPDNVPDLIFGDASGLYLLDGSKRDQPPAFLGAITELSDLQIADLNNDRRQDIVVADGSSLRVFAGLSNGGFAVGKKISDTGAPGYIATSDVDGDGVADLSLGAGSRLQWTAGRCQEPIVGQCTIAPTFEFRGELAGMGVIGSNRVVAADLDGDQDLDLASARFYGGSSLHWLENTDGNGTYGQPKPLFSAVRTDAARLRAADFDGDGDQDLFLSLHEGSTSFDPALKAIFWFENLDGSGKFSAAKRLVNEHVIDFDIIDIDRDGDLDLLALPPYTGQFKVFINTDGRGQLGAPVAVRTDMEAVFLIKAADLDLDGIQDVVIAAGSKNGAVWFKGLAGGLRFDSTPRTIVPPFDFSGGVDSFLNKIIQNIRFADIDGDGDLDAGVVKNGGLFLQENVAGNFQAKPPVRIDDSRAPALGIFDVDLDGDLDLLLDPPKGWFRAIRPSSQPQVGSSTHFVQQPGTCPGKLGGRDLVIGDLNGDGTPDVVQSNDNALSAGSVYLYEGHCTLRPVADAQSVITLEDQAVTVVPTGRDPEGATMTFSLRTGGECDARDVVNGVVTQESNTAFRYVPSADFFGSDQFSYGASDGQVNSASALVTIAVTPVNDPPQFKVGADLLLGQNPPAQVQAGWATDLSAGPANESSQTLRFTLSNDNDGLFSERPAITPEGTLSFDVARNTVGVANVTVVLSDDGGTDNGGVDTATAQTFTITVGQPPTISDIADQAINEDSSTGALSFTVADPNSSDLSKLTVTATSSNTALVSAGGILLAGNGANRSLTITPEADQFGSTTITVTVTDPDGEAASDSFALTVSAVDDAPTISDIPDQLIDEDGTTGALAFTVADKETDLGALTITLTSSNTTLMPLERLELGGTGGNRTLAATPAPRGSGTSTITVTVSDGSQTASDSFLLTVNNVNDTPTITAIANQIIDEDSRTNALSFSVADEETTADALVVQAVSSLESLVPNDPANLQLAGSGANRTLTVIPAANRNGVATITVTVSDGNSSGSSSFELTVRGINDAPTISDVPDQNIDEDGSTGALAVQVGDVDAAATDLIVTASSSNQVLLPDSSIALGGSGTDRTVTASPAANESGTATITLTVSDGSATASDSFALTVNAVNDPPTVTRIAAQTIDEDQSTGPLSFSIDDIDSPIDSLTVASTSLEESVVANNPSSLSLTGSGSDRQLTVTPVANASGTAGVALVVSDGEKTGSSGFQLTVNPVNDRPEARATITPSSVDPAGTVSLDGRESLDIEDAKSELSYLWTCIEEPAGCDEMFIVDDGAALTEADAPTQPGRYVVRLEVTDTQGLVGSVDVEFTVNPPNEAPTISDITDRTILEDESTGALAFTIGDADDALDSLTVTATSSDPTLVPNANLTLAGSGANRTVTATPAANQSGSTTITVTVSDGSASNNDTFVLTVDPVNDAPSAAATAIPASTAPEGLMEFDSSGTSDIEDDAANLSYFWSCLSGPACGEFIFFDPTASRTDAQAPLTPGNYNIQLQVTDPEGASSTAEVLVEVSSGP